ncbi:Fanconi anemia group E protein [Pholidichthys leucotaenia]
MSGREGPDSSGRCDAVHGCLCAALLSRFDGPSRLLVRSLLSGASGLHEALTVFSRQQRANRHTSLGGFIDTLCGDEVTDPGTEAGLTVKPLVCLFPASFKQNLLSFLYLVHTGLPRTAVGHLLKRLSLDSNPNPWVTALSRQLERNLGSERGEPLCTSACSRQLKELSQRLVSVGEPGGWAKCFSSSTAKPEAQIVSVPELGTQRKRRASWIDLDSDSEGTGLQSKRRRTDVCGEEHADVQEQEAKRETGQPDGHVPAETPCDALPDHIKVFVLQIKELLESQTEWDQGATDLFKVLNDCEPDQVEALCSILSLPDLPEATLPKLCSGVLSLSPDLSYSAAATLVKSLLLEKVLSLSEPASRCLVTVAASLCGRYPRPTCHALIGPVLEEKNMGPPQAELLNRLIEGCLDSHYRLLVAQTTFKIPWSEAVLAVIHSLLDSKVVLNEELFSQFTEHLLSQAPQFTKSVKFAKMMLTVLTKYNSNVTAAHKHSLASCLTLNETFLKKSLQAALKRIAHT